MLCKHCGGEGGYQKRVEVFGRTLFEPCECEWCHGTGTEPKQEDQEEADAHGH